MELKLQDRERELHALQIDNEAVCVKIVINGFFVCFYARYVYWCILISLF